MFGGWCSFDPNSPQTQVRRTHLADYPVYLEVRGPQQLQLCSMSNPLCTPRPLQRTHPLAAWAKLVALSYSCLQCGLHTGLHTGDLRLKRLLRRVPMREQQQGSVMGRAGSSAGAGDCWRTATPRGRPPSPSFPSVSFPLSGVRTVFCGCSLSQHRAGTEEGVSVKSGRPLDGVEEPPPLEVRTAHGNLLVSVLQCLPGFSCFSALC